MSHLLVFVRCRLCWNSVHRSECHQHPDCHQHLSIWDPSVYLPIHPKFPMSVLSSLDTSTLLLGGAVLLCLWWWLSTRRPPGIPPGPGLALPLLGHLLLLGKDPRPQFIKWRRQYGDVFSLYLGGKLTVVLASHSAIKEAFLTFAHVFSDRPHDFLIGQITKHKGIASTSGREWKEQRKTSLEILRQMGMGKNLLAGKIQEEVTHYIRAIKDHQGAPADLCRMTQVSVSNVTCSIIFGKRFHYKDPEFLRYMELFERNFMILSGTGILNFIPKLKHVPGDPFRGQETEGIMQQIYSFVDKQVSEHQSAMGQGRGEKGDTDEETKSDFIYSYLHQMQNHVKMGDPDSSLNAESLEKTVGDLFAAGTETTSTSITWTLLLFLHHPHVQDRCFQEIHDVIGPHRPPAMSDKLRLPYLEATVQEVLRIGDIVPLSVMHACSSDTTFRGHVIPKGTMVIPALTCVLTDPDIWGDPENFRPERFIGPDGKVLKSEELIPFSMGRRACVGESLARMELYLFLANLIQNFRFLPAEEGRLPSLKGHFGLTNTPEAYKIRAVPRM